jgi:hypothetical protein
MKDTSPSPSMSVSYTKKQLYDIANAAIAEAWEEICNTGHYKSVADISIPEINTFIRPIQKCFNEVCDIYDDKNNNYKTIIYWNNNKKKYVCVITYEPDTYSNFCSIDCDDEDEVVYSN